MIADRFIVHSCSIGLALVDAATASGRAVKAEVPCVNVELVADGHLHGTVTRCYVPESDEELKSLVEKYVVGRRILVPTHPHDEVVEETETAAP
jgi:hypothetical protein